MDSRFYNAEQERILEQVRKTLDHLYPPKNKECICKFAKVCKGYQKEAYTCQHEGEAIWYCGLYKRHEAAILQGDMKRMLEGTDFAEFGI